MLAVTETKSGKKYIGYSNDYLFNLISQGNEFVDDFLLPVIDKYVKRESVCIDIGANLGYVSLHLAERCRHVYCVEPQPLVFKQLCANLFINQALNTTPINLGCLDFTSCLTFSSYQSGWVGSDSLNDYNNIRSVGGVSFTPGKTGAELTESCGDKCIIKARRLDDIIFDLVPQEHARNIGFIKIDAQGADISVILGSEGIIEITRPVIVFEYEEDMSINNYGRTLSDLDQFLNKNKYIKTQLFEGNYLLCPNELQ